MVDANDGNETWVGFWGSIVAATLVCLALLLSMQGQSTEVRNSVSAAAAVTTVEQPTRLQQYASFVAASELPDMQ
jgi:hypothetical protein